MKKDYDDLSKNVYNFRECIMYRLETLQANEGNEVLVYDSSGEDIGGWFHGVISNVKSHGEYTLKQSGTEKDFIFNDHDLETLLLLGTQE